LQDLRERPPAVSELGMLDFARGKTEAVLEIMHFSDNVWLWSSGQRISV